MITKGDNFRNATHLLRKDSRGVGRVHIKFHDVSICVKDAINATMLAVSLFEPGLGRSPIHAVLIEDARDNIRHSLPHELNLAYVESGRG